MFAREGVPAKKNSERPPTIVGMFSQCKSEQDTSYHKVLHQCTSTRLCRLSAYNLIHFTTFLNATARTARALREQTKDVW